MTPEKQIKTATAGLPKVTFESRWNSKAIAGKGTWSPRFVMLHHTAGTNSLRVLKNTAWPPVRGAHFLIDRDGTIHVLSAMKAYHAGRGGPRWGVAAGMMNGYAWGIEIEDPGKGTTMTDAQIDSAARLSAGLLKAMGRPLDNLIQHKEWNRVGKVDTRYSTAFWVAEVGKHMKSAPAVVVQQDTAGTLTIGSKVTQWRDYSGKPKTMQVVAADNKWHRLVGIDVAAPPISGTEQHVLYARLGFLWRQDAEGRMAVCECKWVRDGGTPGKPADDDPTAYKELHFEHGTKSVPFDQLHLEEGEAGVGGSWWMRFSGGLVGVDVSTRYAKTYVTAVTA